MLKIIAHIHFDPTKRARLLDIYDDFVPQVLAEDGCHQYEPHEDRLTELPNQLREEGRFLVLEQWRDWESFQAHLQAPHVIEFRKSIQGIVSDVKVNVLQSLKKG
jgi:quinol monooxygenase YgiN